MVLIKRAKGTKSGADQGILSDYITILNGLLTTSEGIATRLIVELMMSPPPLTPTFTLRRILLITRLNLITTL
jgi:hypothetical protein